MSYILKPLSDALGAEVIGLDLCEVPEQSIIDSLMDDFHQHQVLVFRDQNLSKEAQIKACGAFGEIEPHPLVDNTTGFEEITVMSNVSEDGKPLGYVSPPFPIWHVDLCYTEVPAKMTFLYAHVVPPKGGSTLFSNAYKAYDTLSESIKEKLNNKKASYTSGKKLIERFKSKGFDMHIDERDIQPNVLHPVFRVHPETARRAIMVNWTHTDFIDGLPEEESQALLDQIFEHTIKDEFVYEHFYKPGDLIVWDNAATVHTGGTVYPEYERTMHRVMIKGSPTT